MVTYQLILMDTKTGQPQSIELINSSLDLSQPLQKKLYLDTINSLSVDREVVETEGKGEAIHLRVQSKERRKKEKDTPSVTVHEPSEGESRKKSR